MFSIKFNKAQISHRHATDAPPTHLVRYKFKEWSTRRPTVGRLSADCRPTVDRLSADCRSTVDRRVGRRVGRHVGGIGFFTFTTKSMAWNYLATLSNALWIAFVLRQDIPKALDKIVNDSFAQSLVAGRYS